MTNVQKQGLAVRLANRISDSGARPIPANPRDYAETVAMVLGESGFPAARASVQEAADRLAFVEAQAEDVYRAARESTWGALAAFPEASALVAEVFRLANAEATRRRPEKRGDRDTTPRREPESQPRPRRFTDWAVRFYPRAS